jgi:membrane protease YdiL (CAAX protease family)
VKPLTEGLLASTVVTAAVTLTSLYVPERHVALAVAFVFLAATYVLVWRRDDACVERAGLALGGLVLPGPLDRPRLRRDLQRALAFAALCAALTFVPFFFGWRLFWHATGAFVWRVQSWEGFNEAVGQLVLVALPEEAFYRGYLQTRLEEAWRPRIRIFGAELGVGSLLTSAIFALGHIATIHEPARLAVFFPSLVFGWLRARTGGIGAGVAFHAGCNLFSELLSRGYR